MRLSFQSTARRARKAAGFTLIEILLVIVIILLLAGALVVFVLPQQEGAEKNTTRLLLNNISPLTTETVFTSLSCVVRAWGQRWQA